MKTTRTLVLAAAFAISVAASPARAETGVTADQVKIGVCNDQSGPVKDLGSEIKRGFELFIHKTNAAGGVNGRKIEPVYRDDAYNPEKTNHETRELIEKDQVFALAAFVGTPTTKAILPLIDNSNIPYVAPYTGGDFMRSPFDANLFPARAAYADEAAELVEHLVDDLGIKEIGIFTQDDAYGASGRAGVARALNKRGLKLQGEGIYSAKSPTEIEGAMKSLQAAKPKAVILFSILKSTVPFLKRAKEVGFSPVFAAASPINAIGTIKAVGKDADGIYVSEGIPLPSDHSVPLVRNFQEDLKATGNTSQTVSTLEGYLMANVLVEGLKLAGKDLTRASFRTGMETMRDYDLHGLKLTYTPQQHQGLSRVYLTKIKDGKPQPVSRFE